MVALSAHCCRTPPADSKGKCETGAGRRSPRVPERRLGRFKGRAGAQGAGVQVQAKSWER